MTIMYQLQIQGQQQRYFFIESWLLTIMQRWCWRWQLLMHVGPKPKVQHRPQWRAVVSINAIPCSSDIIMIIMIIMIIKIIKNIKKIKVIIIIVSNVLLFIVAMLLQLCLMYLSSWYWYNNDDDNDDIIGDSDSDCDDSDIDAGKREAQEMFSKMACCPVVWLWTVWCEASTNPNS